MCIPGKILTHHWSLDHFSSSIWRKMLSILPQNIASHQCEFWQLFNNSQNVQLRLKKGIRNVCLWFWGGEEAVFLSDSIWFYIKINHLSKDTCQIWNHGSLGQEIFFKRTEGTWLSLFNLLASLLTCQHDTYLSMRNSICCFCHRSKI